LTQGSDRTHTTPITRVEVNTGKQTLGVWLAPTWSDATKYQFRLQEAIKLHPRLLRAPLNQESTRTGFTTKVQISVRCYVLHRKWVQQHSSQIYANSTIKNGHQQVHAYRSMIRTISLCRYVSVRTLAYPRIQQE
jgi:hypothetical protein